MPVERWVGIKYAPIDVAAAQTDAELVASVEGKRIRVVAYFFTVGAAGTVLFESGIATALTGVMDFGGNGVGSFAGSVYGPAFETAIGDSLTLTSTGAGADVRGHLSYQVV